MIKSILVLLSSIALMKAGNVDSNMIDYYVKLIQNRTEAAASHVFPTDARMHEPENKTIEEYGSFDFIVIGAGSTGSIIASRLAEVKEWSVLLIEAGSFPDEDLTRIPALYGIDAASKFNWGYTTVPQKNFCWRHKNNICSLSRGKGIGGTSLINGLLYSRGNRRDYKKWSYSLNDLSYTYENLLRFFHKTENFTKTNPNFPVDWMYHGTRGPLDISQSISNSELEDALLRGTQQIAWFSSDYNGMHQLGVNVIQSFTENGFRDDPGQAFISSGQPRENLKVLERSYVMKLDIDNYTKRINGVIFSKNNKTYIARNLKEVILSAGVIGSPQILMLSGIGPQDHLSSLGIQVTQNLPVGENLRDHVITDLPCTSNATFPHQTIEDQVEELLKGRGRLTSAFNLNVISFFKVPKGLPGNFPDIEMIFTNSLGSLNDNSGTFYILYDILYPNSVGSIKLKSSDPFEYPLIDTNNFSNEKDIELVYEAAQIVVKLLKTQALKRFNVTLALGEVPECDRFQPLSKEYWYCHLKLLSVPGNHLIGTCSTGRNPDEGVVDRDLKVFGIQDLRVADASIIPFPFANHPVATCAVIAEKISDQLKKLYLY